MSISDAIEHYLLGFKFPAGFRYWCTENTDETVARAQLFCRCAMPTFLMTLDS